MSEQSSSWSDAGMIPARNSAREQSQYTDSPQFALQDQVETLHFLPPVPGLGDVQPSTLEVAVNAAILGKKDPEAALSDAASDATELMGKNLEKFGG
jgi:multiple sugar transport system substrate-binding protein